jgi:hypothetical protein
LNAVILLWLFVVTVALSFNVTLTLLDRGTIQAAPANEITETVVIKEIHYVEAVPPPDRNPKR